MDNNVNLVAARKRKNKRKKKFMYNNNMNMNMRRPQPQPPHTNPAATLQGLKTIANLIHLRQQLSQSVHNPNYASNDPRPLMSGPRITKPMFNPRMPGLTVLGLETNTSPATTSLSTNLKERNISTPDKNINQLNNAPSTSQKDTQVSKLQEQQPQNESINIKDPTTKDLQSKGNNDKQNFKTNPKQHFKKDNIHTIRNRNFTKPFKNEQMKKKSFQQYSGIQDNQFDDFEIYNNPSFMSFETTDEVVDLNDDNLNLNQSVNDTKQFENNHQKHIQSNFQIKLQEQYAKKLEIQNKSEPTAKTTPDAGMPEKPLQLTGQDEAKKKANKELLEGLSSDIKTVVQNNIKSNLQHDNMFINRNTQQQASQPAITRLPAGIPRSFLHRITEPQQQSHAEMPSTLNNSSLFNRMVNANLHDSQMLVQTQNTNMSQPQAYSPTDIYQDTKNYDGSQDGSESPDLLEPGNKRVSAFQRLGPVSQTKKPKLTINLCLNKDQAVREVINETQSHTPVQDRDDINSSTDDIVVKYLPYWPWNKSVGVRKSVTARQSKTVMMMEKEQMEEIYDNDSSFIMVSVTGYPPSWMKEDILDVMLENLKGTFIPIFIEFSEKECKFFVIRCRGALMTIHWLQFEIRKEDVELSITISQTYLTDKHIDFKPRIVLRKRLEAKYDGKKIDLSEFTLKNDISHFIYFPLNRKHNQSELMQLPSNVAWDRLTELDLSHNRITSIEGFNLTTETPHLKVLNLSHNNIDSVLVLLPCKHLPLKKLTLEGNPLCLDYIDADRYVTVVRKIFCGLRELDGVLINLKGELPKSIRNYCPEDATTVVEKFLEVFFTLLDLENDERQNIKDLYVKNAVMTITCRSKLRYESTYKHMRNFSIKSQNFLEGNIDCVEGIGNISKLIRKWPHTKHDPTTFTTDVLYHDDTSTIFKIAGILKVTAESLAEEEPLMAFSRTIVLSTNDGCQYKIQNELMYWDEPTEEYASIAFRTVMIPRKTLTLKFESIPDEFTKKRLISIFMQLTELEEKPSERCLESKNWHFQHALEHFMKLLKLDNIQSLHV